MLNVRTTHSAARERALAEALKEVVAELRLVEVIDYIAFLRLELYGNIADLVSSASELHLKPGVLRFGQGGEIDLTWGSVPSVTLDMEFRYEPACVHFRLELGAVTAGVDITYVAFDDPHAEPEINTARLLRAFEEAKLKRQPAESSH